MILEGRNATITFDGVTLDLGTVEDTEFTFTAPEATPREPFTFNFSSEVRFVGTSEGRLRYWLKRKARKQPMRCTLATERATVEFLATFRRHCTSLPRVARRVGRTRARVQRAACR